MSLKSLIDKLMRLAGAAGNPALTTPETIFKPAKKKREPKKREIVSPEEQMALDRKDIAFNLQTVEMGKTLLSHGDPKDVERGRHMIGYNQYQTPRAYDIGQIKWRLGLGDPSEDLEAAVKYYAMMLQDEQRYGVQSNTSWFSLVAFLCVILSGSVPDWVARTVFGDPSALRGSQNGSRFTKSILATSSRSRWPCTQAAFRPTGRAS